MICLGEPYHLKFFKGLLPQILLGPFLIPWPNYISSSSFSVLILTHSVSMFPCIFFFFFFPVLHRNQWKVGTKWINKTDPPKEVSLHKKWSFPLRISSVKMWPNPQFHVDLVTFTEEIFNGKLHFLCSV